MRIPGTGKKQEGSIFPSRSEISMAPESSDTDYVFVKESAIIARQLPVLSFES